jgi:DNA-binding transcriptional regulator YhcF (GntR family)
MSEGLDLSVDRASEVALGTQLIWKVRALIASGALPAGAKLPGIREVAETAGVNVNTVRSVFARLEEQGLIVSEHGRGTFVAEGARLDAKLADATELVIATARESGIDPQELAAAVYVSPRVPEAPVAVEGQRGERQALYREVERLEREVGQLDPLTALEPRPTADAQPRMLALAELRAVRDELAARVEHLRRERQQWRVEAEQAREAERREAAREAAERGADRGGDHPWRAGIWTGHPGAAISWTRA